MKIKFDKICSCLQLQGYDGLKEWWELRKRMERKMKLARIYEPEKYEAYKDVLEIVKQDGKRIMKDCEKCNQ